MTSAAEAFIQLGLGRLFARTSQQQYDLMCGERIAAFASPNSVIEGREQSEERYTSQYRESVKTQLAGAPDWLSLAPKET